MNNCWRYIVNTTLTSNQKLVDVNKIFSSKERFTPMYIKMYRWQEVMGYMTCVSLCIPLMWGVKVLHYIIYVNTSQNNNIIVRYALLRLYQECEHHKTQLQQIRRENASLDTQFHENNKSINQLKTTVAVLQQEIKDKEQVTIGPHCVSGIYSVVRWSPRPQSYSIQPINRRYFMYNYS